MIHENSMAKFDDHPTMKWWREQSTSAPSIIMAPLNSDALRSLCIEAGADDVGFVEVDRPSIAHQQSEVKLT